MRRTSSPSRGTNTVPRSTIGSGSGATGASRMRRSSAGRIVREVDLRERLPDAPPSPAAERRERRRLVALPPPGPEHVGIGGGPRVALHDRERDDDRRAGRQRVSAHVARRGRACGGWRRPVARAAASRGRRRRPGSAGTRLSLATSRVSAIDGGSCAAMSSTSSSSAMSAADTSGSSRRTTPMRSSPRSPARRRASISAAQDRPGAARRGAGTPRCRRARPARRRRPGSVNGGLPGVRRARRNALMAARARCSSRTPSTSRTNTSSTSWRMRSSSRNASPPRGHASACFSAKRAIDSLPSRSASGLRPIGDLRRRAARCCSPSPPNAPRVEAIGRIRRRASPACAATGSESASAATASGSATTTSGRAVARRIVKTSPNCACNAAQHAERVAVQPDGLGDRAGGRSGREAGHTAALPVSAPWRRRRPSRSSRS